MKTIVETKTEKYYCITEKEAEYLHRFLGEFSDSQIARILKCDAKDFIRDLLGENKDA